MQVRLKQLKKQRLLPLFAKNNSPSLVREGFDRAKLSAKKIQPTDDVAEAVCDGIFQYLGKDGGQP